ncbi:hypothetical protein PanWU01x14_310730 [Parasponia andersonii]|uniref:Uncharacterized protein n=1 Tax=Parasponia andersonii TaxID=3476 RepID=A0A2P5AQ38_PARAD|nr:hypothetical protein PanWU01x14_310730 [Parasponia andersonii]
MSSNKVGDLKTLPTTDPSSSSSPYNSRNSLATLSSYSDKRSILHTCACETTQKDRKRHNPRPTQIKTKLQKLCLRRTSKASSFSRVSERVPVWTRRWRHRGRSWGWETQTITASESEVGKRVSCRGRKRVLESGSHLFGAIMKRPWLQTTLSRLKLSAVSPSGNSNDTHSCRCLSLSP